MKLKYTYCEKENKRLIRQLENGKARYQCIGDGKHVPRMIGFSIWQDAPCFADVTRLCRGRPVVITEYSQEELEQAAYLCMRPVKQVIDITNSEQAFRYECPTRSFFGETRYHHAVQVGTLSACFSGNRNPKEYFFASTTGFAELFVREAAVEYMRQDQSLHGIVFKPVHMSAGAERLYQMTAERVISQDAIDYPGKKKHCPVCGKVRYMVDDRYQLNLRLNRENMALDFYETEAIFGSGFPMPFFLVSKCLYGLLKKHQLTKGVRFCPVSFLDEGDYVN